MKRRIGSSLDPARIAADVASAIGREVGLARVTHALSVRAAARIAGVAPATQRRVERGDPHVEVATLCTVAAAMGLKVWTRAFPATAPTLRDTGQLWIAGWIRDRAHGSLSVATEVSLGNLRSADQVIFGPREIVHVEIERLIADWQAQFRVASDKRDVLAAAHQRPVRLVVAIEDTRRNRDAIRPHAALIGSMLPAGTRDVLRALRTGAPLGQDGLLWVRRRRGGDQ